VLRLGPRLSESDFGKPIDRFLASLAEDQGDRAVGIILSGTGSDGTVGLRAIKERGGLTIAQLPESAAYDGMPRSAIDAGIVDYILPPEEIPSRLIEQLSQVAHDPTEKPGDARPPVEDSLTGIWEVLRSRTGHDFSPYKRNTLLRRLGRRMGALQVESPAEYLKRLERDTGEADRLFKEMLIGVTGFFRDRETFDALSQSVLPDFFAGKGERDDLRVWVVGCASGEEVYSLAILFAEEMAHRPAPPRLQIFASDIDEASLKVARRGRYTESACRDVSPERLQRFFTREGGDYQVRKELRQLCIFSKHNVLRDPPFRDLDLISCRNVLIYMDSSVQGKLIALFHHSLRKGGALLLGTAENIAGRADRFESVERGQRIYRRRELMMRRPVEFPLTWGPARGSAGSGRPATSGVGPDAALSRSVERAILEHYAPAGMVVREDGEVEYLFGPTAKYIGPSAGAPSLNALALLRKGLRTELRHALKTAARTRERVTAECRLIDRSEGDDAAGVVFRVRPFFEVDSDRALYLVIIQDLPDYPAVPAHAPPRPPDEESRDLQLELRDTREQLQATIDELEAANQELRLSNEELLSMNEELQSANEELQSSKEEVQTINAELEAVNREIRQKVKELDTAKSDLETLFEGSQIATIFLDNELNIKRFTPTATELFRLRTGDVGRPVTDITTRFTDGDLSGKILQVLRTLQREEVTVTRADDGSRYLMRVLPYRTRENLIDGAVITFVDVSELKRAQEALEEADRRKDEFLATLAHELRNPLAAIASGIRLWQSQDVSEPTVIRAREIAARQVTHTRYLIEGLLDRARIVLGAVELRRVFLDLRLLLKDVADVGRTSTESPHDISLELPAQPLTVSGDPDRLQQVFGNLMHNAQKFTGPGGRITIGAEAADGEVVVRVRDDGVGIPAELLPRVFEPFVQIPSSGGVGLGLTIVRQLVLLHGGNVEARSPSEGDKGSEFIVRLPLAIEPSSQRPPPTPGAGPAGRSVKRILVVDDNQDVLELLALELGMEGHEVVTASDGQAALHAAVEFRPDVVLLDLGLPVMDGYEVARQLRQVPELAGIAIVAVTGYGGEQDRQRSREAGIDHHLLKPLEAVAIERLFGELNRQLQG
jgi:two-component system, chemotaxis family, CheB/CheR fusion protein